MIEKYGSGIKRVREAMENVSAPDPVFEIIGECFKVTLFPVGSSVSGGVNGGVSGGVNSVKAFITEHPGVNSREIAKALDMPQRTVERHIKDLKLKNKIEFKGAPKTGGYFLLV